MELLDFFDAFEADGFGLPKQFSAGRMRTGLIINDGHAKINPKECDIFLFSLDFDKSQAQANRLFRKYFYHLSFIENLRICDLGTLKSGASEKENHAGLEMVLKEIFSMGALPLVLGKDGRAYHCFFKALSESRDEISMGDINSKIHIDPDELCMDDFISPLNEIPDKNLYRFINIGYQTYLNPLGQSKKSGTYLSEVFRLGKLREDITEVEPYLRSMDLAGMNLGAVRYADAPGAKDLSPNGLYAEEICRIARYAGAADSIASFYVYGYGDDLHEQSMHLLAQMVWFIMEGYGLRRGEYPYEDTTKYKKHIVSMGKEGSDILFYQNMRTGRWWMEIPVKEGENSLIPCSVKDYESASRFDMSDRWMFYFKALNQ